jgi:uncharacterized membrane protein
MTETVGTGFRGRVHGPAWARRLGVRGSSLVLLAPVALATAAAVGLALASVFRHDRFGSNAYDLGIYDQSVWGFSRFDLAADNTVLRTPTLLIDHFQPIVMTLAPLYWLWEDARVLLIAQAALLASASVPVFLWARQQLGVAAAFGFQAAYLVFWGVLGGNLYDFHEVAFAAPIVAWALYGALTDRPRLLLAMTALALLTKESLALTFVAIGLFVAFARGRRRLGLAIAAASAVWFALVFEVVLPALTDGPYANWFYSDLGSGPGEALVHVVRHPLDTIELFFTPEGKLTGLLNLFAPWLALPLLSPLAPVMLPTLAERFLADKPAYWQQGFHYSIVIAPMLALAAIDATARLARRLGGRARAFLPVGTAVLVLALGAYFSFIRLRPLDELRRYTSAAHAAEIRACLDTIPGDASVAATSAVVPHLSQRPEVYVIDRRPLPRTDFLALDAYTWTYPLTSRDVAALAERSQRAGFGVVCSRSGVAVLRRGETGGSLSPELRRLAEGTA